VDNLHDHHVNAHDDVLLPKIRELSSKRYFLIKITKKPLHSIPLYISNVGVRCHDRDGDDGNVNDDGHEQYQNKFEVKIEE